MADCLPALPVYTPSYNYVGCYSYEGLSTSSLSGVDYRYWISTGGGTTPENCVYQAGINGFNYANIFYGSFCIGTSSLIFTDIVSDSTCDTPCTGNTSEYCGSAAAASIYEITNPATSDDEFSAAIYPDCTREPLCSNPVCDQSLSLEERVAGLTSQMTLQEKVDNMGSSSPGVLRLGLPFYDWWNEALHGVARSSGVIYGEAPFLEGTNWTSSTSFPMPILTSAAFDDALVRDIGAIVGAEARAFANAHHAGYDFWTPNINPFKDPRWGRGDETPGEDPYRVQSYVYALVDGMQGGIGPEDQQVIATCKHFAVYDVETGREYYDYDPTAQELSEYYLAPFKTCARDAKAGGIMCSYNAVDGIPSCANRFLLQTMLREHWGWDNPYHWVTSDCAAVTDIVEHHNYSSSFPDAAASALNAGTDLACEYSGIYGTLSESVAEGTTTEELVDQAISRLYGALVRIGYFGSSSKYNTLNWSNVNTPEAQYLAYNAAVEGMTLLKNDGTLPLPKNISNVAVIGPWANATTQMQGNYYGNAPYLISPLEAMQSAWIDVAFAAGTDINTTDTSGFAEAITIAQASDYIIYCGGIDTTIEAEELDRTSIIWPGNQLELITELAALQKPTVVIQFGGGQVDDTLLLENNNVSSILWAGYPGQDGGNALRNILDGSRAVAGRLPVTQYPAEYVNEVSIFDPGLRPNASIQSPGRTHMWYPSPVLPFGYGLQYTNFSLSFDQTPLTSYSIKDILSDAYDVIDRTPFVNVTAEVTNTGGPANMTSDFTGLLFLSSTAGPTPRPIKTLVAYDRVFNVSIGETQVLNLQLTLASLARAESNGSFSIYPGTYNLLLGVEDPVTFNFTLTGQETIIDAVPLAPNAAVPILYLGCYSANMTLNSSLSTLGTTTSPQDCARTCYDNDYTYAVLKDGSDCLCSTTISSTAAMVNASSCSSACSGDSEETCGGPSYIEIYKITPNDTLQAPTWSP